MPPLTYPLINGIRYSWASIEMQANGLIIPGVRSINYSDTLTPGKPRGTSSVWLGHTLGQYEADADMEVFREEHEVYKLSLGGIGFMERPHIIVVNYFEPTRGVLADVLNVRIMGNQIANSDSSDATVIKHTLSVLSPILWNGVPGVTPRV
jgi:hypothetical protein